MARKDFPDNYFYGSVDDDPYAGLYVGEPLENFVVDDIVKEECRPLTRAVTERRRRDNRDHPWRMRPRRPSL